MSNESVSRGAPRPERPATAGFASTSVRPPPGEPKLPDAASVKPHRLIAGSFDALVRSIQLNPSVVAEIARRCAENWQLYSQSVLEVRSTEVFVDGQLSLTATA